MTAAEPSRQAPVPLRRVVELVGTLAVGGFFLWLVLRETSWADFVERLRGVHWPLMALSLLLYYAVYVFRGLRLWQVCYRRIPLSLSTVIAFVYQMLVNYIPAGAGNVTLPAILARYGGVATPAGTKVLVALRLLDLAVICGLACLAGLSVADLHPAMRLIAAFAGGLAAVGLAGLLWPRPLGRLGLSVWRIISRGRAGRLGQWLEQTLTIKDQAGFHKMLPGLFLTTAAFGLGRAYANWLALRSLQVDLTLWQAWYQWAFTSLAGALPFQPPAGLGLSDAIRMALLLTVGQSLATAAEVVLVTRVLIALLDGLLIAVTLGYLHGRAAGLRPERT
ncbi:MAG: flippase-like domain-containing protein [Armatimonadetes bacterium]|nr:flippase-like domain-containing protein [Armatimonadota bacterium]